MDEGDDRTESLVLLAVLLYLDLAREAQLSIRAIGHQDWLASMNLV